MTRIDLVALQQRLAPQQPKQATPVRAEPPSWSKRPVPASALRTAPAPKASAVTASAAAPAGTLRATTPMRAALPLKATNARAERAEERARSNTLRTQIDELNAALALARAEADRALAEERQRVDRLNKQVEALSAEVVRAEKQAEAVVGRPNGRRRPGTPSAPWPRRFGAPSRALAGQATMAEMHARELAVARRTPSGEAGDCGYGRQMRRGRAGLAWRGSGRRGGGNSECRPLMTCDGFFRRRVAAGGRCRPWPAIRCCHVMVPAGGPCTVSMR